MSTFRLTTLGLAILLLTFAGSISPGAVSAQQASACATGGAVPDPDDNPGLVSDCATLLAARDTLAGAATLNWAADTPMSEWDGVRYQGTPLRVDWLGLRDKGLTGEIPAGLGNLSNLGELSLFDNQLSGEIPTELGSLSNLLVLYLHGNQLTGEIPSELGNLSNLRFLSLRENQLTGEVPAELGNLSNLTRLILNSNQLTGELPQSLTGLTALSVFTFDDNAGLCAPTDEAFQTWLQSVPFVSGDNCVPEDSAEDRAVLVELYNATDGANWADNTNWLSDEPMREWHGVTTDDEGRVTEVILFRNQLTGGIPAELGNLSNLTGLVLATNQLTGEIPADLGNLSNLTGLTLSGNQLRGEIPADLGNLSNLTRLQLHSNLLTGELPQSLTGLTVLVTLSFHDNAGLCAPIDEAFQTWLKSVSLVSGSSCAPMDSAEDRAVLVEFYNATDGANWTDNTNWLSDRPIREWHGVSNDADGRVSDLLLGRNELTGEIPTELGSLSNLTNLVLHANHLTGEIPTELGNLSNLTQLILHANQLTGEIPTELGNLSNLTFMFLNNNQLTGELPQSLTGLTMLVRLHFDNNASLCAPTDEAFQTWLQSVPTVSGDNCVAEDSAEDRAVLVELYNATDGANWADNTNWLSDEPMREWHGVTTDDEGRVARLSLSENQLTGEIPTELANLSNLQSLDLGGNQLTGEIPAELGNLSNLERLFLGGNRIGGGIPAELGNLTNLTELLLGDGLGLTGEFPPELSRLTQLEVIDLGGSEMSGAIPAWLGDLTRLRALYLDGNRFSGELPSELGNLTRLKLLPLHGNAGLLGALPQTLTKITGLDWLTFYDTGLCAPLNESFQTWLRSILDHEGPNCLPEPPAGTTERVIFRDVFGREVNETGLVLVDWEGHIANPAMKYFVELPGATATMSSSEPRLYFDLPSSAGPNGPTRALVSEDPTQAAEFHISIFPDRDTSDESHTLTIRYVVGGGRVSSQTIDVHVIDQDVDRPLEFEVIPDFRHDETGMFDDPAAREDVQQAANDFAYFIADMSLDEVPPGEEPIWIYRGGLDDGVTVTNDISYTGFLMYVYGLLNDDRTAGSDPSCGGSNQSSNGVEIPVRRSGSIFFDPRGVYDNFGWTTSIDEDTWWNGHGQGPAPNDLYSVALHEAGHVLVFYGGCNDVFGFYEAREVRDATVMAYYGSYPRMNDAHHFFDSIDPISRRGVFGNENGGEMALGRWLLTKFDLLIAQAIGYVLRDTSPFRELSLLNESLAEGSAGAPYAHTVRAVGGIPAYHWTVDSGALPDGLSLDSFTGTISGTPQESGTFEVTIRVQDNTVGSQGVVRVVNLNIGDGPSDSSDEAVLLAARDTLAGTATLNWSADVPISEWDGIGDDSLEGTPPQVVRLYLGGLGLDGAVPSELSGLTELKELYLQDNDLSGPVPVELGDLSSLTHLHLQNNDLTGGIPAELGDLAVLRELRLDSNDLTGQLPAELGSLTRVTRLWVADNDLSGSIPAELGDMANLDWLNLGRNNFSGQIPAELGNLSRMRRLYIYENDLSGPIPGALGNLSRLTHIVAQANDLSGEIPVELGNLENMVWMGLHDNDLTGEIPAELGGLAKLQRLYLTNNELYGEVPEELGDLSALTNLWLNHNYLSGQIPQSLDNLDKLSRLRLAGNRFNGCLPAGLAAVRNSDADQLGLETCADAATGTAYGGRSETLGAVAPRQATTGDCATGVAVPDAANNPGLVSDCGALLAAREALVGTTGNAELNWSADTPISEWDGIEEDSLEGSPQRVTRLYLNGLGLGGTIPSGLSGLTALKELYIHDNDLAGPVPPELGDLSGLTHLHLQNNDLTGGIPAELGDLAVLRELRLDSNDLTGQLAPELGKLTRATRLWVADNDLSGPIPAELGDMANLDWLNLGRNNLNGQIPTELGDLSRMRRLYVYENDLSGPIPGTLGSLSRLTHIVAQANDLSGEIPTELGNLSSFVWMGLHDNDLTGEIPAELGSLAKLQRLYLTNNELYGEVPEELGDLSALTNLWLNHNYLSGQIPQSLDNLERLSRLRLAGNRFTGCLPAGLAAVRNSDADELGLETCSDS